MDREKAASAARNNAAWCAAVCAAHGRPGRFEPELWVSEQPVPRLYPNLVTLSDRPATAEPEIERLLSADLDGDWAVKDSFAVLDLGARGFRCLFEAQWLWRESRSTVAQPDTRWTRATTADALMAWEAAWAGRADPTPVPTFPASLLSDPNIAFFRCEHEGRIVAGLAANCAAGVVGLSNVFGDLQLTAAVAQVERYFPGRALVSYEPTDNLARLGAVGFETIGPLRVWLREH